MLKNAYFREKIVKIVTLSEAPPPNPRSSPAAGDSALRPPLAITTLSSSFLTYNAFYCSQTKNNYSKCSAFASFALFATIFHFKLHSFCWRGRKNISCARVQGTLPIMPLT